MSLPGKRSVRLKRVDGHLDGFIDGFRATVACLHAAVALFILSCLSPGAWARQADGRATRAEVDPYTEGKPEVMAKLGLRHFGPFRFGDGRTTEVVARDAGSIPFLWVESAHFQVGCSLEPLKFPDDPKAKKRLQAEIKVLAKTLPNVPRRLKELDPWLVLHLYVNRLEALHREFVARLHLEDTAAKDSYLGNGGPICILLTEKKSTMARYTAAACGSASDTSLRFYFNKPFGQLFFGIAFESLEGDLHTDQGLHFALVHSVARVLGDSLRGYSGNLPTWYSIGLGHWFAREMVDDEILLYTTPRGDAGHGKEDANFGVKVRGRVANDVYPSFEQMEAWDEPSSLRFSDHMMAWSRMDFFLRADGGNRAKAFLWGASEPLAWSVSDRKAKLAAQWHGVLMDIAGGDLSRLDKAWAEWVLDEYPRR